MTSFDLELSRRQVLASLGAIGAASVGAGLGTTAFFGDREELSNNRLTAGELDLRVGFEEHYSNWSPDEAARLAGNVSMPADGTVGEPLVGLPTQESINGSPVIAAQNASDAAQFLNDTAGESPDVGDEARDRVPDGFDASQVEASTSPCESGLLVSKVEQPTIRLSDVKPGDFGEVTITFALCDNPGFVWLVGQLVDASENGTTEPEADDSDEESGVVELVDRVETAVWIDDGNNYQNSDESIVFTGTLRDALTAFDPGDGFGNVEQAQKGLVLPGTIPAEQGGGRGANCFAAAETHSVVFAWWLPVDHANEIQTDEVTFDLGLYTEQCRHNEVGEVLAPTATLSPTDTVSDAYFGADAALDGDTAVISADGLDLEGKNTGAVYLFERTAGKPRWTQTGRVSPSNPGTGALFGEAVDLSGDTLVCGATGDDENGDAAGAAYVFGRRNDGWTRTAKVTPANAAAGDSFGQDVAVASDRLLVGADGESSNGSEAGAVYEFERTSAGWSERKKITPADGSSGDYFGVRVALAADTLAVSAYGRDTDESENVGAVYVFDRDGDGWSRTATLVPPEETAGGFFGSSIALSPDSILVGAFQAGDDRSGVAYVFPREQNGYGTPARLDPRSATRGDFFGWAAGLGDGTAIVGAYGDGAAGRKAGVAYGFTRSDGNWTLQRRLEPQTLGANDRFGSTVVVESALALVTADGRDRGGSNAGSAYTFDITDV